ncbi:MULTISPECIES: antirepressor AbbA [Bacillaceae]|uniref:antirepressor AbbA n=1 Tax=Bacillaceae TaxID=186817 RepID=UPI000BEE02CF|nr:MULTISPECIES: antirepressor AbbA [unclassified Bacillus (in: firmicutes)]PEC49909.1 recombinase XerD [Bacillus sp. AFS096315]PFM79417.1 recombinase XerD [Bacillus sp. AFS077874]
MLSEQNFTEDELSLLVDTVMKQNYAIELISSQITDIENGLMAAGEDQYERLIHLYQKLRDLGL